MGILCSIPGNVRATWVKIARPFAEIASRRRSLAYLDQQIAQRRENRRTGESELGEGGRGMINTPQCR